MKLFAAIAVVAALLMCTGPIPVKSDCFSTTFTCDEINAVCFKHDIHAVECQASDNDCTLNIQKCTKKNEPEFNVLNICAGIGSDITFLSMSCSK